MVKKLALLISGIVILTAAHAQEPVTKKGIPVLPHKGDWGIGFDVVPIIKYAGNLFHSSDNHDDLSINYPLTITARYMHRDNVAYRMMISESYTSNKQDTLVPKQGSTNTNEQVADETVNNSSFVRAGFGIQRYIGKSRVRGFYGGEVMVSVQGAQTKYNFGNALGAQNPVTARTIQIKQGTTVGFGARAFFGVEVYIAPKISLSAEYGFSPLTINSTGANQVKTESWDGSAVKTETKSTKGKSSTASVGTDSNNGSVSLLFYFK